MMANLDCGFPTTIVWTAFSSIVFDAISITPPGISTGGGVEQTSQANTTWRTMKPRKLLSLSDATVTVRYDAAIFDTGEAVALVGTNDEITVTFADLSTLVFWAWADSFTPGALNEEDEVEAEVTIIASNLNASSAETGPVYAAAPAPSP